MQFLALRLNQRSLSLLREMADLRSFWCDTKHLSDPLTDREFSVLGRELSCLLEITFPFSGTGHILRYFSYLLLHIRGCTTISTLVGLFSCRFLATAVFAVSECETWRWPYYHYYVNARDLDYPSSYVSVSQ